MSRAVVVIALLLSGCATAKTMMLTENTALISGKSFYDWNSASDVQRKILTTAALMAQERGFEYFEIVSSTDTTKQGLVAVPGQATTNTYGSTYCTGYWCAGQGASYTSGTPGYVAPYTQAGADVIVRFYRAADAPRNAYSVAAILSQN